MYLIRNSLKNISRNKKKYALLITVITLVSFFSFISLVVLSSSEKYLEKQKEEYGSVVSIDQNFEDIFSNPNGGGNPGEGGQGLEIPSDSLEGKYEDIANNSEYVDKLIVKSQGSAGLEDSLKVVGKSESDDSMNEFSMGESGFSMPLDIQVSAYSDFDSLKLFGQDVELYDGEFPQNENEVVISQQLLELNGLKIGDEIKINVGKDEVSYKIVGTTTETSSSEQAFVPMQNAANNVYMTTDGMERLDETIKDEGYKTGFNEYLYVLNSYKDVDNFTNWLYENTDATEDTHTVSYANSELESIISPIANLTGTLRIYLIVTAVIGMLIILFIIQLNFKDRSYEIGVLRALNMSKTKLIFSFIIEIIGATLIAFVIAIVISIALVKPIGNMIVNSANTSTTEDVMGMPMDGAQPVMGPGKQSQTSEITDMDISIDLKVIVIDLGVLLLIVIISSVYGLSYVYRYNPNKILKERG